MRIFYDTHAHLAYPDFAADFSDVMQRAQAAGITKILSIGTQLESSQRAIQLAEKLPNVFAVVGWHPSYVMDAPDDLRPALCEMAKHPKVVALGEAGLDYHRLPSKVAAKNAAKKDAPPSPVPPAAALADEDSQYKQKQAELFRQHLEVAAELGLNCVIHQREAQEDTLTQLEPFSKQVRGVFHCFGEELSILRRVLALGSLVSFTGILTFKNGENIRDALAATPMDSFMLETDCPYLAPTPYRGKRCEPAYVKEISEVAAQVKNCSLEELSTATCATAEKFFRNLS